VSLLRRAVTGRKALSWPTTAWSEDAARSAFHFLPWGSEEKADQAFAGMVQNAYKRNGIIFALCMTRRFVLSEARFQYRRMTNGRPGDLFGAPELSILEHPWGRTSTTGDLISRMMLSDTQAGNAFVAKRQNRLTLLKPEYTTIIMADHGEPVEHPWQIDAEVVGYAYDVPGREIEILTPGEVAHFAPNPDPDYRFRGMSWVTPVLDELEADQAATTHKLKFFKSGGTPQVIVTVDKDMTPERFKEFQVKLDRKYSGARNAYKTWYLGGGADAKVVGKDLKQLDFRSTQGAGETRIAAAAGVPPVIAGFSEGLQSATYSNYGQARRRFADGTLRPLWRNLAGSLSVLVDPPKNAGPDVALWYDDRDIAFLREDAKDSAEIMNRNMLTIESGVRGGFEPETVKAAVAAGDLTLMKHTGLYSVQLQPPGTVAKEPTPAPAPPEENP
jgi:HK97 family phage portal protein